MGAEDIRQSMLKQMGIEPWFPRMPLPGAATSHRYDMDPAGHDPAINISIVNETNAPVAKVDTHQTTSVPPAPSVQPAYQGQGAVLPTASEVESAPRTDMPSLPVTPVRGDDDVADELWPAFAFSWFSVDRRLAVLAMLPDGESSVSRSCRQMLARILAALNNDYQQVKLDEHSFHWPFPEDLGLPSGSLAARQAVDGFVARRLRESPAAMLLVLADDTPPFLFPKGTVSDEAGVLCVHRQFGFAMLRTHSLHGMERSPELKRSAWQAMKVLLDRLNRKTE